MAKVVRIGLIGAGANTRLRHIPGFQAIPGVEIVAVCNRSAERWGHPLLLLGALLIDFLFGYVIFCLQSYFENGIKYVFVSVSFNSLVLDVGVHCV